MTLETFFFRKTLYTIYSTTWKLIPITCTPSINIIATLVSLLCCMYICIKKKEIIHGGAIRCVFCQGVL